MNAFASLNKNNYLSIISTVFMSILLLLAIQGCSSSNSSPVLPIVTVTDMAVVEGNNDTVDLVFTATLDKTSTSAITFVFETVDATAVAGTDYVVSMGTAEIVAGETSTTITVTVNGDTDIEPDETFTLNLTNPMGATLAVSSVIGTITSNDHADPSAYYTGSATVINPNDLTGNTISLSDLRVMISANRIMMMNTVDEGADEIILYDAQITNVNGNDITADVTIYVNMHTGVPGEKIQTTLTGTVNESGGIVGVIGTANDTLAGTGTFEVLFSDLSNETSSSANIDNKWSGALNGRIATGINNAGMILLFTLSGAGDISITFGDAPAGGLFSSCDASGTILPISSESLYAVTLNFSTCSDFRNDGDYTGFISPTSLANDNLIIAFSNALASGVGFLAIAP